ncbi:MAG: hypothetical protein RL020_954, partial [Pseudomonadota bacterium]
MIRMMHKEWIVLAKQELENNA